MAKKIGFAALSKEARVAMARKAGKAAQKKRRAEGRPAFAKKPVSKKKSK